MKKMIVSLAFLSMSNNFNLEQKNDLQDSKMNFFELKNRVSKLLEMRKENFGKNFDDELKIEFDESMQNLLGLVDSNTLQNEYNSIDRELTLDDQWNALQELPQVDQFLLLERIQKFPKQKNDDSTLKIEGDAAIALWQSLLKKRH